MKVRSRLAWASLHARLAAVSLDFENDRDRQRHTLARRLPRWRRKRLRALQHRQRLLVERGDAGTAHHAALEHAAQSVEHERHLRDAMLAAPAGRLGKAQVALDRR